MGGEVAEWELSQSRFGYEQQKALSEMFLFILRNQAFTLKRDERYGCFSNNNPFQRKRISAPIVRVSIKKSLLLYSHLNHHTHKKGDF